MITTHLQTIPLPLQEDPVAKWRPYDLFSGTTPAHDRMACHVSVLSAGHSPHPPHQHDEEEVLVVLEGGLDVLITDGPRTDGARVEHLHPGSFVYYPAHQHHTIRNVGASPATYLMFKWKSDALMGEQPLGPTFYHFASSSPLAPGERFAPPPLFEQPTTYLSKLHAHLTQLRPGAGYPPHADPYDVGIVVLSGRVETLDRIVGPSGLIYYSAGELHGMKNVGDETARYLVFEFHSPRCAAAAAAESGREPAHGVDESADSPVQGPQAASSSGSPDISAGPLGVIRRRLAGIVHGLLRA